MKHNRWRFDTDADLQFDVMAQTARLNLGFAAEGEFIHELS